MAKAQKSVAPVMSALEQLNVLKAKMAAEIAALETQAKAEETARVEKLNGVLATLPELLGVADMETVRNMVLTYAKHGTVAPASKSLAVTGTLNEGAKFKRGDKIPEAEKETARGLIREALSKGTALSEVAKVTGISYGTIFSWSKDIRAEIEAARAAAPAEQSA